jgi:AcrR family transcriptional regulator
MPRDSEATRARILSAALQEVAANGLAGARVDTIAERAQVDEKTLHRYFSSKEDLFQEMQRRIDVRAEPGRATSRNSEATKARILDAALYEFVAKGMAGARVDEIAARARIDKRMLYHYFGSKEGLYREMLRRRRHDRMPARRSAVASPDRLVDYAERISPDFVRLLLWESLEAGDDPVGDEEERREYFVAWLASIREEQQAGHLPDDMDAEQLLLEELLASLGPSLLPQIVRFVTGRSPTDPVFIEHRQEFLRTLTRRLDAPPPPTTSAS